MKTRVLLRKIHYWGSLIIMLQMGVIIGAGLLLMLKKDIHWIQPPTQKGVELSALPNLGINDLFKSAQTVPELQIMQWDELSRVDIKPNKGIAKFVSHNNWEAQIDTKTGKILQVKYRRSDIIESIHDGSYFSDTVKRYVFLPSGIILFFLWITGVYLFFLPYIQRIKKARKRPKTT